MFWSIRWCKSIRGCNIFHRGKVSCSFPKVTDKGKKGQRFRRCTIPLQNKAADAYSRWNGRRERQWAYFEVSIKLLSVTNNIVGSRTAAMDNLGASIVAVPEWGADPPPFCLVSEAPKFKNYFFFLFFLWFFLKISEYLYGLKFNYLCIGPLRL